MTRATLLAFATTSILSLGLIGCTSTSKALGLTKTTPNEFNILTKAPLVVPPEYNLRPPQVGEASSEDNYSQKAARDALIGDFDPAEPSRGEILLLTEAGVGRANQEIRLEIDGDNAVERKTPGLSDRILFWQRGQGVTSEGQPLNAEDEAERLRSINAATGGGEVTISKRPAIAKLPGL